ncbi:ribonuclease P protein component [Chlamydia ibidis]|uniref:ribonuclease P protein component n=1 Tax=Chlamydia ibidis TaxID=1405396 RepID=UPI0009BF5F49|nr:ribonuclease P protein component [Chlamydia ibidis]
MQRLTLPKCARVLKRKQFVHITRSGFSSQGSQVVFYVAPLRHHTSCKLGITVSKKFGKAHKRNYFKRLVREAFRQTRHALPACQIVVMPKRDKRLPEFKTLLIDFSQHIPEIVVKMSRHKSMTGGGYNLKNAKCVNALP